MRELMQMLENLSNDIDSFFSRLSRRQRTPQQERNARAMRRWWRSFKKEGELMIPFIVGILLLGFIGWVAVTSAHMWWFLLVLMRSAGVWGRPKNGANYSWLVVDSVQYRASQALLGHNSMLMSVNVEVKMQMRMILIYTISWKNMSNSKCLLSLKPAWL